MQNASSHRYFWRPAQPIGGPLPINHRAISGVKEQFREGHRTRVRTPGADNWFWPLQASDFTSSAELPLLTWTDLSQEWTGQQMLQKNFIQRTELLKQSQMLAFFFFFKKKISSPIS